MATRALLIQSRRHFSNGAIQNVTMVGGGLMGSGIAQVAAQAGNNVTILEVGQEQLKNAQNIIGQSLGRVAKRLHKDDPNAANKFIEETTSRIQGVTDLARSVENSDLVVEAVVENMELKHKIFKELDEAAPQKTLFASNTSSLSIAEIGSVVQRKDRFGGLHFFNPVPVMRLLEVIRTPDTSEQTHQTLMRWGKSIGKTCVTCKDTPGFIVNRLLVPYLAEAARMLERGDATAEDIDTAMKLGAGHPMGPLELLDYTGLDTGVFIMEGWHRKYPDNPLFKPVELQKKLVAQGRLGRKSGRGFYDYRKL
ncbi:hydroxyacyl-coenzyme A dehydrogenase, mitochondrial-like [Anthonomus grandis grandis]|uniref:hydroxyacyl-coenzyme A dehydrogenase, mitochondrial-like n=1 Tax=Anthonomus grandis grandis TaxID=2921223 RepID=UPI002165B555|nr:hydroxyacyl-coenzyme A dehydrogenase, mitochondrial-like [Anthonomus grandis grandis]